MTTPVILTSALLSASISIVCGQAVWKANPVSGEWHDPANWAPANVPDTKTESAVFPASTVTTINTGYRTVKQVTVTGAGYVFSGSQLTLDANTTGTPLPVLDFQTGAGAVRIDSSLYIHNSASFGSSGPLVINTGAGVTADFGPGDPWNLGSVIQMGSHVDLAFGGSGTVNVRAEIRGYQVRQTGATTVNIFKTPGLSQSFSNSGDLRAMDGAGRMNLYFDNGRNALPRLGIGSSVGTRHTGRLYFAKDFSDGNRSTHTFVASGGSGSHTADLTLGTDIPGNGRVFLGRIGFQNALSGTGSDAVFRLDVGEDDTLTIESIGGSAGGYANPVVRKQGRGTAYFFLGAVYRMPTHVEEGTLIHNSAIRSMPVTVGPEGHLISKFLLGGGAIEGGLTVQDLGRYSLYSAGSASIIFMPSLTLGTGPQGASFTVDTGASGPPTVAPVQCAGPLSISGSGTMSLLGGELTTGVVPLISHTGPLSGDIQNYTLILPPRATGLLQHNSAGIVEANITSIERPRWNGDVSGEWDIDPDGMGVQGTANWRTSVSGTPTKYLQGSAGTDSVLFDDRAEGTREVQINSVVQPSSILVSNSGPAFTFAGSGRIDGLGGLRKRGAAPLIMRNTVKHTFTGGTVIEPGATIQIGDGITPGAGYLSSSSGTTVDGVLAFERPDDFSLESDLSGTGRIVQRRNTVATLGRLYNFSGTVEIQAGSVLLSWNSSSSATFTGPGTLRVAADVALTGDIAPGAIVVSNGSTLTFGSITNNTGTTPVNVSTDVTCENGSVRIRHTSPAYTFPRRIHGPGILYIGTSSPGTAEATAVTVLRPGQTFSGPVYIDSGALRITDATCLGTGTKSVWLHRYQSRLLLDGRAGAITLPPSLSLYATNKDGDDSIVNEGGVNTIAGTLAVNSGTGATGAPVNVQSGSLTLAGAITATGSSAQLLLRGPGNGTVSGNMGNGSSSYILSLGKESTGTWNLTGANTYTGPTSISAGRLLVNGTLGNTPVTVATPAILSGSGSIGGPVTIQGTLAPGGSNIGMLTLDSLAMTPGSALRSRITDWTGSAGVGYDAGTVTGALVLTATEANPLSIHVEGTGLSHFAETAARFTLIHAAGGITGFDPAAVKVLATGIPAWGTWTATVAGNALELDYTPSAGYDTWAAAAGLTAETSGQYADPDHDGLVNALEFFTNSNPLSAANNLPSVRISGGMIHFTFRRRDDAGNRRAIVEACTDLTGETWTPLQDGVDGVIFTVSENGAAPDEIAVAVPVGDSVTRFLRLRLP